MTPHDIAAARKAVDKANEAYDLALVASGLTIMSNPTITRDILLVSPERYERLQKLSKRNQPPKAKK